MRVSINKVYIQNFKIFGTIQVNFESSSLVVFDGPNGFGKTSFYDAIELLLTGQIRRYKSLSDTAIDNRESYKENPYINTASPKSELIIKAELIVSGNRLCILRKYSEAESPIENLGDFKPKLYHAESYDSVVHHEVENEAVFLEGILGKNYLTNFEFLNYIEQGDSTYILRKKGKERKSAISHIFNTKIFDSKIEKIDESSKLIGTLCNKQAQGKINSLETELSLIKNATLTEVPYVKLIDSSPAWDLQKLDFSNGEYAKWLGTTGDVNLLKELILNKTEFHSYNRTQLIVELIKNSEILKKTLFTYNFLDSREKLSAQDTNVKALQKTLSSIEKGLLQAIEAGDLDLTPSLRSILDNLSSQDSYEKDLDSIKTLITTTDSLSKIVNQLKETRDSLIKNLETYEEYTQADSNCPLCGHNWGSNKSLHEKIKKQSEEVESILSTGNDQLKIALENFTSRQLTKLVPLVETHIKEKTINSELLIELSDHKSTDSEIKTYFFSLKTLIPNAESYLYTSPENIFTDNSEHIISVLRSIISNAPETIITSAHKNIFVSVLKENNERLESLREEDITKKISYIEWQYSLFQSNSYQVKLKEVEAANNNFQKAKILKRELDAIKKIHETSLKDYQTNIIQNIEILFHIYSARIVQDTQGGLGLFINSDKDGIRFLDNPKKQYDAAFSMSSGQLSALVISFTLALNKRYSHNKLLLIDDPVQTMDDLNVAGLVDLLRQEFHDRQIFIATHEHMMSAYMRYKFQKYGLNTKQVNFKNIGK